VTLARQVAVTTAALVAARGVVIVAGIVAVGLASHYLGVGEYGALTAAMAFASSFAVLTDLGLSTVAAREIAVAPDRTRAIVGNVITVGLALGVAAAGLAVAAMFIAFPGDGRHDTRVAIAILLVQLAAAPFSGAARAHFTAAGRGHVIAVGDMALAGFMALATLVVVEADLGFLAVVAAVAGGYVAQAIALAIAAARARGLYVSLDRREWATLTRLALPLGGALILNYLYFRLDILLLAWLKDDEAVGLYGLAYRVIEALMVLPGYVMLGLFPEIARSGTDPGRLSSLVGAAVAAMEVIALALVVTTIAFADEVVQVIGGGGFEDAAPVLRILMIAVGLSYLNGVYGNALVALGRQGALLRVTAAVLVVNIAVNLALIPPFGVEGAAVAVVISEVVGLYVIRRLYIGVASAPPPAPHLRIAAAGAITGALLVLKLLLPDDLPAAAVAIVGGLLAMAVYGALALALRAVPEPLAARLPRLRAP
jgi:O-antigen/teichoic acid export membrane protein